MSAISTTQLIQLYLDAIESELKQAVERADSLGITSLRDIFSYHMGWQEEATSPNKRGKRFRPLLVLLTCTAAGGDWQRALPAAAAVELVHNFSLIHDDIEDHSPLRRGRPTIWNKWGIPQAINSGDAMFALAHLEALRIKVTVSNEVALETEEILQDTCLKLTLGQHLDLAFEKRVDLTPEDYWRMVEGKTAALISSSTRLGALAAGADKAICDHYGIFGLNLGFAFQAQDDLLGIWGDSVLTGKSTESDLVTGKITLPVLFGLSQEGKFAQHWKQDPIKDADLSELTVQLESEGGKAYAQSQVNEFIEKALASLELAQPRGLAGEALKNLALRIIDRQS